MLWRQIEDRQAIGIPQTRIALRRHKNPSLLATGLSILLPGPSDEGRLQTGRVTADNQAMKVGPESELRSASSRALMGDRLLIFLMTLGLYGLLMQRYPIIYGGDPVVRLVNFPKILMGYQLPLLQVLIHYTMRWFYGPGGIFWLMAFISAAACAGLHALTWEITQDRRAAWMAAILYATHPFVLYYSRVPYQEPLLMAAIAWGFYYLFRRASLTDSLLSSTFFGLACFSRYEGWIAALAAAFFRIRQKRQSEGKIEFASVIQSLALFGWAPAVWILWNRDLSPAGSYVLDLGLEWGRLYRPYFVMKSALWWTESAVVLMALAGLVYSWLDARIRNERRTLALLGLLVLLLAALLFSGHGIEPDPTRLVTEREAFIPVSILVLYAGIGGGWLSSECRKRLANSPWLRSGIPLLALLVAAGYGLNRGIHRVAAANADADLKTDYQVAQFLAGKQASGLVLASPLPGEPIESYLRSVEKWSGPKGRERALRFLQEVETTPLDYQRVLMFSWLGKDKIISADRLRGLPSPDIERFLREKQIEYLVVFSDFAPVAEHERIITDLYAGRRSPELEIRNGDKAARVYSLRF